MSRRYWARAATSAHRWWPLPLVLGGLLGAFAYGWFALLPELNDAPTSVVGRAAVSADSRTRIDPDDLSRASVQNRTRATSAVGASSPGADDARATADNAPRADADRGAAVAAGDSAGAAPEVSTSAVRAAAAASLERAAPLGSPVAAADAGAPSRSAAPLKAQTPAADAAHVPTDDACASALTAALGNARIEFRSASAEILPASRSTLSVLAALAHVCPGSIVIDGHSDDLGPELVNEQISLERAQAVAEEFTAYGIEPQRLQVRAFGSSRPVADNSSPTGRARNRRIEMTYATAQSAKTPE